MKLQVIVLLRTLVHLITCIASQYLQQFQHPWKRLCVNSLDLFFDRNGYKPSGYVAAEAGSLPRLERLFRILISWILLFISKIVAITTPLFFQSLVEKATEAEKSFNSDVSTQLVIQSAAFGLILGYCISRVASGVVQLISEFVLFPATSSVARILPVEAFSAALQSAYKRGEGSSSKRKHSNGVESLSNPRKAQQATQGFLIVD